MSKKNLFNDKAFEKLKELAEDIDIAMMQTNITNKPAHSIPMSTKEVDSEGCIWFLSNKSSEHNTHLKSDNSLQLIYSKPSAMEFLTVYGHAHITTDMAVLKELYQSSDDAWFDGIDDPNLTAIKVIPETVHYWDTKNGKFVSLLKMAAGAITGSKQDLGEEGKLLLS